MVFLMEQIEGNLSHHVSASEGYEPTPFIDFDSFNIVTKKEYYEQDEIGTSKYTVSFNNGIDRHKDGSLFYHIQTFSNKREKNVFVKDLISKGYKKPILIIGNSIVTDRKFLAVFRCVHVRHSKRHWIIWIAANNRNILMDYCYCIRGICLIGK